jgi:hypothetical protein
MMRLSVRRPMRLARLWEIDLERWMSIAQTGGIGRSRSRNPTISLLMLMTLAVLLLAMAAHFGVVKRLR